MKPNEISFVVQGAVDHSISPLTGEPITKSCLAALRRYYPGAEVILSTWPDENIDNLDYDVLILNEDPGAWNAFREDAGEVKLDNTNRQIVSARAGLRAAGRKYAAKLRSDIIFRGNGWMQYYDRFPQRTGEWRIFRERLVTCSMWARDPWCPYSRQPLHPPDWIYIGLREDLLLLWDIDLQPEPESSQWFLNRDPAPLPLPAEPDLRRFSPEQYLWRTLLAKHGPVHFNFRGDLSAYNIRLTELSFANNLIILDLNQFPFVVHKYPLPMNPWYRYYRFLSHKEWERLYLHYCCGKSVWRAKLLDPHYYLKKAYVAVCGPWQQLRGLAGSVSGNQTLPRQQST